MAKIFYGNGECEVVGENIVLCQLMVKYPIEIDDKSPDGFILVARHKKIIIGVLSLDVNSQLKEMFHYVGNLNIISATVMNKNGDKERAVIKRVMDYTELLNTNAEDMTTLSENLKSAHTYGRRVGRMKLMKPYLENLTTEHKNCYLQDGSPYTGSYHYHLDDGQRMTGRTHTEESLSLYFKDIYEGDVKEGLILYSNKNLKQTRFRRTQGKKVRRKY